MKKKELIKDSFWSRIIKAIKEDRVTDAPWLVTKEENDKLDKEWEEHVVKMNNKEYKSVSEEGLRILGKSLYNDQSRVCVRFFFA